MVGCNLVTYLGSRLFTFDPVFSVRNAASASRRTVAAITCSATTANTTSAGCALVTGKPTGQSTTSVPGNDDTQPLRIGHLNTTLVLNGSDKSGFLSGLIFQMASEIWTQWSFPSVFFAQWKGDSSGLLPSSLH